MEEARQYTPMNSYILEHIQSVFAGIPPFEEIRPVLEDAAFKVVGGVLGALAMGIVFWLALRLRKSQAVREDGWYYLTPGFVAWFMLMTSSLISVGTLTGGGIALRTGYYQPTFEASGLGQIGMFAFFILGFGALARVSYIFYFRHKIRWNHSTIEKLDGRRLAARIAWRDVQEVYQKAGADHLRIESEEDCIKVWTHMNGIEQLIAAIDGDEMAFGLLRQIRPSIEAKPRPDYAGSFHPEHR